MAPKRKFLSASAVVRLSFLDLVGQCDAWSISPLPDANDPLMILESRAKLAKIIAECQAMKF